MRLTANGDLIWSRSFGEGRWHTMNALGLFVEGNQLTLIATDYELIWKIDMPLTAGGNISLARVGYDWVDYNNRINTLVLTYNTQMVRLQNGNFRIMSRTTASYTTTWRDTSSIIGVLDLSPQFDPVAYRLLYAKTRANFNANVIYSLQPNGRIDAGVFEYISSYSGNYYISQFSPNGGAIKHRKLTYRGVGLPNWPHLIAEYNGEQNFLQTYYDSTAKQFFIENSKLHFSDTASACLGYDTTLFFWGADRYKKISGTERLPVYDTTVLPTVHTVWQDTLLKTDLFAGCSQVNYCDSLRIIPPNIKVCRPGQVITLDAFVNKACGGWVQWRPAFPEKMQVTVQGPAKAAIQFKGNYDGWLYAEMQGNCAYLKDSIRFTVADLPDPLTLGPDTVICPGNLITLRATPGYAAYQWSSGFSGDSMVVSAPGKYWVTARDACGDTIADTIMVKAYVPAAFSAGEDQRICPGEAITLHATEGFLNYKWTPAMGMQQPAIASPTVRPAQTTLYRVQAEERPGCVVADSVLVTVARINPFSLGADFSICRGSSRVIEGPGGFATYRWSNGATTRDILVTQPGAYSLEAVSDEGCPMRDTVNLISLHALPVVQLQRDTVLCAGETRTYSTGAFYQAYLWSNGYTTATISVQQPGQYWVRVTDTNGCAGSDTARIAFVQPLPADFLPRDTSICGYDSWDIKPLKAFAAYVWSNGASASFITVNQANTYRLSVTDTYGCKGTDEVVVSLKECMQGLFVPNAFSPNGDGTNDSFKAMLFGNIEFFDLRIFNRFGQEIFSSRQTAAVWDGSFKGKLQPAGAYIWQCRYKLQGQQEKQEKGSFVLLR